MKTYWFLILLVFLAGFNCNAQKGEGRKNRKPAVAGAFYEADSRALEYDLERLFAKAKPKINEGPVRVLVAPHAGYSYSGIVAASAYSQLDRDHSYKRIFLLGSSHRVGFSGASVYHIGNYETPLGEVPVDTELATGLISEHKVFSFQQQAHLQEHSLEVQLPFLQYWLVSGYKIIPILLGTHDIDQCREIAAALLPYYTPDNLFVVSTDFSHYPSYEDACEIDRITAEGVKTNSVEEFAGTISINMDKNIPNLVTCMCAWPAVMTMLFITQEDPGIRVNLIDYRNSGDSDIGDKSRVVGYYAIAFTGLEKTLTESSKEQSMKDIEFELTEKDKMDLLGIARQTLTEYMYTRVVPGIDISGISGNIRMPAGAFVTLNKDGELRGCIGRFEPDSPLYQVVQDMTVAAATRDSRFTPVLVSELDEIEIEISVLSPMRRIYSLDELELGRHGIYIKKGYQSGTYLPQVAQKTKWSKEEFVCHCSRDKAKIGWEGWKDAELYTYEAFVFKESSQQ